MLKNLNEMLELKMINPSRFASPYPHSAPNTLEINAKSKTSAPKSLAIWLFVAPRLKCKATSFFRAKIIALRLVFTLKLAINRIVAQISRISDLIFSSTMPSLIETCAMGFAVICESLNDSPICLTSAKLPYKTNFA